MELPTGYAFRPDKRLNRPGQLAIKQSARVSPVLVAISVTGSFSNLLHVHHNSHFLPAYLISRLTVVAFFVQRVLPARSFATLYVGNATMSRFMYMKGQVKLPLHESVSVKTQLGTVQ